MGKVGINMLPLCDFSWSVIYCPGVRIDPGNSRGWMGVEVIDMVVLGRDGVGIARGGIEGGGP